MMCMMAFATTVRGQSASYWSCDPHAYRYDMTAYVQLKCDGMLLTDYSDYEVAAFSSFTSCQLFSASSRLM